MFGVTLLAMIRSIGSVSCYGYLQAERATQLMGGTVLAYIMYYGLREDIFSMVAITSRYRVLSSFPGQTRSPFPFKTTSTNAESSFPLTSRQELFNSQNFFLPTKPLYTILTSQIPNLNTSIQCARNHFPTLRSRLPAHLIQCPTSRLSIPRPGHRNLWIR